MAITRTFRIYRTPQRATRKPGWRCSKIGCNRLLAEMNSKGRAAGKIKCGKCGQINER